MPEIIEGQQVQNDLDRQLRFYRESELEYIRKVATRLRESATDVQEALQEVEHFLAQLKNLTVEVRVGNLIVIRLIDRLSTSLKIVKKSRNLNRTI